MSLEIDFISELDQALTNVGTDVVWKRKIGKIELWLSPMSVSGQEKVTAALDQVTPGLNLVAESKKITLSNSIVGVNKLDFRSYRGTNKPEFPITGRDGKMVNVAIEKYLYEKMSGWSTDYLDDVFRVYADLMETFQRDNLKDIKFENAKDPRTELEELESRVSALRAQLGLPQLTEKSDEETVKPSPEEIAQALDDEEKAVGTGNFNPFNPLSDEGSRDPQLEPEPPPEPIYRRPQPPSPPPQPVMGMPVTLPNKLRRPVPPSQSMESSPDSPHVIMPSVPNEVIEKPAERSAERPQIDRVTGVNPRFQPQRR